MPLHPRRSNPSQQLPHRPGVGINKVLDMLGYALTRNVAPGLNFLSHVFGNVVRPVLQSVEGYDANRIVELPSHKIADDGLEVRALDFGLAVNSAAPETVNDEIDRLIGAVRNSGWRPARSGHRDTPSNRNPAGIKPTVPATARGTPGRSSGRGNWVT